MTATAITETADSALQSYKERTNALLTEIRQWAQALDLQVQHEGVVEINEEVYGQYAMPSLALHDAQGRLLARVKPFGASIFGAAGRVDLEGEYGKREKIVYLHEGGPVMTMRIGHDDQEHSHRFYRGVDSEGWYWVAPPPIRRAYVVTQEVFVDLLSAVSGREF